MVQPAVEAEIEVHAPADKVYRLVSEVTGLPAVARECVHCAWLDGANGPTVGARFRGWNRRGPFWWATTSTVLTADPGRRFSFLVRSLGLPVAEWSYQITATEYGCRVVESTTDRRTVVHHVLGPLTTGVRNRSEHNRQNIVRTLERLKAAAEATP